MTTYNDVPHGGKSFHGTSTSQGAVDGKYIVDGAEEKQTSWSVNNVPNVTVPTPVSYTHLTLPTKRIV